MPHVSFAGILRRHAPCPPLEVTGRTAADVLQQVFAANPAIRPYLVDDQGRLRRHVTLFVNGRMLSDRAGLSDAVAEGDEVFVAQALSGG